MTYAGNLSNGSYLDYYIKVTEKGEYTINLGLAAGDAQWNADSILINLNDTTVATVPVQASSSWTTFVSHTATMNFAAKGTYKLSVVAQNGACNITDFTMTKNQEITTPELTTEEPETTTSPIAIGDRPEEVFGQIIESNSDNSIRVVWGRNITMEEQGQVYNVYVDGVLKLSNIACGDYTLSDISAGTHTVKITSVLNGYESDGVTGTVTVNGEGTEVPTTGDSSVKLEINGAQISSTVEGYRVIYSISDPEGEVANAGLVYGLADYTTESDMIVGSTNSTVYSFEATDAGKMNVSFSEMSNAQSYAMTMKFIKTAEFYTTPINVRAYAHLKDGTYVYGDVKTYTVYDIADYLYQNLKMNNSSSHDYLYNEILSVVNPAYIVKDFNWNDILVNP